MKKQLSVPTIAILMAAMCLILVLPLAAISRYAQPFADDYKYGASTAAAWLDTGSLFSVLKTAAEQVGVYYETWQGTYSALFLMCLQPGIFGINVYWIGAAFLIALFAFSNLYFLWQVLHKVLKATAWEALAVASAMLLLMFQYVHDAGEAFYWFNGAMYYTGFHCLMLILFGAIASMYGKGRPSVLGVAVCALLCAILGGGNYATALFTAVVLFILTAAAFARRSSLKYALLVLTVILLAGLLVSALAPGNTRRQGAVERYIGNGLSPLKAVLMSFAVGGYILSSAMNLPAVVVFIFALPFLYEASERSTWSFKKPLLVIGFAFCVYCTLATPPLYAMGLHIADRLQNVLYYTAWLLIGFSLYYLMGWAVRRIAAKPEAAHPFDGLMRLFSKRRTAFFVACCLMFFVACVGTCGVTEEDGKMRITNMPTGVEAALAIVSGKASEYRQETLDRVDRIEKAEKGADLVVPRHKDKMPLISYEDITDDPKDWKNVRMAQFYGLGSIRTE